MYINAEDSGIAPDLLTSGMYEPFQTELLRKLITKNMTVVNIGANIGYYTLIAANKVGPNGKVYAFEPEPKNYQLLIKNIEKNGYKNILPIQVAISDKQGTLKLFLDKSNLGNPSLAEQNIGEKNGFVEVKTNSLDNFFEKHSKDFKVDLLLMDTQGAEGLILDGAKKIIRNNKLKIIMEFWPWGLNNVGTDALNLLKRLKKYGFKIGLINETNKCINYLLPEKIVGMCKNSQNGRGYVDLLLEK
ncbi:MAG: FkbM family methyltransferase [Candidatus Berkelbacteria bacterium]|nr:FkbM family methyltransferase [Candidatus Berkelbacteria bacterium]